MFVVVQYVLFFASCLAALAAAVTAVILTVVEDSRRGEERARDSGQAPASGRPRVVGQPQAARSGVDPLGSAYAAVPSTPPGRPGNSGPPAPPRPPARQAAWPPIPIPGQYPAGPAQGQYPPGQYHQGQVAPDRHSPGQYPAAHTPGYGASPVYIDPAERQDRRSAFYLNVLLYVGALLIVAAAGSFVLLALPGLAKAAFLWGATAVFAAAGLLLHQFVGRLRPVGIAFTGTALAVLPFAGVGVGAWDVATPQWAWLFTSAAGLVLYVLAAVLIGSRVISWLAVGYVFSLALSLASVSSAPVVWHIVALVLASTLLRIVARFSTGALKYLFAPAGASLGGWVPFVLLLVALAANIGAGGLAIVYWVVAGHFVVSAVLRHLRTQTAAARITGSLALVFTLWWLGDSVDRTSETHATIMGVGLAVLGLVQVAIALPLARRDRRHYSELAWVVYGLILLVTASTLLAPNAINNEELRWAFLAGMLLCLALAGAISGISAVLLQRRWLWIGVSVALLLMAFVPGVIPGSSMDIGPGLAFTVLYAAFAVAALASPAAAVLWPKPFAALAGSIASIAVGAYAADARVFGTLLIVVLALLMVAAFVISRDALLVAPWALLTLYGMTMSLGGFGEGDPQGLLFACLVVPLSALVLMIVLIAVLTRWTTPAAAPLAPTIRTPEAGPIPSPPIPSPQGAAAPARGAPGGGEFPVPGIISLAVAVISAFALLMWILLIPLVVPSGLKTALGLPIPFLIAAAGVWLAERRARRLSAVRATAVVVAPWVAFGSLLLGIGMKALGTEIGDSPLVSLPGPFITVVVGIVLALWLRRVYAVVPLLLAIGTLAQAVAGLFIDDDSLRVVVEGWTVWAAGYSIYWVARARAGKPQDRSGLRAAFPTAATIMSFSVAGLALLFAAARSFGITVTVSWLHSLPLVIGGFTVAAIAITVGLLGVGTGRGRTLNSLFLEPAMYVAGLGLAAMIGGLAPTSWVILIHIIVAPAFVMAFVNRGQGAFATRIRWIPAMALLTIVVGIAALLTEGWESMVFLVDHAALLVFGAVRTRPEALWWGLAGVAAAVFLALRELLWLALLILGLMIIGVVVWQLLRPRKPNASGGAVRTAGGDPAWQGVLPVPPVAMGYGGAPAGPGGHPNAGGYTPPTGYQPQGWHGHQPPTPLPPQEWPPAPPAPRTPPPASRQDPHGSGRREWSPGAAGQPPGRPTHPPGPPPSREPWSEPPSEPGRRH